MTGALTRSLSRRVQALERRAGKAQPKYRNVLLELAIRAMACAWTPDEVERMLAEGCELDKLDADLRRRWVEQLDRISMRHYRRPYRALLALSDRDREALPPLRFRDHSKRLRNEIP